jgi:polysaccharide export outer membrane protein
LLLAVLLLPSLAGYAATQPGQYILAPDDGLTIRVAELPELDPKALGVVKVDHQGNINLPLAGRIHASGLTIEDLEKKIAESLSSIMRAPEVVVSVAEYRSHPVSVLGAVRTPGVYQVSGTKTLFEVLSLAGGLNPDASNRVKITRQRSAGPLPLPNVITDDSGKFLVGELNVHDIMDAKSPEENIIVRPNDVITVPKADLVYVVGAVRRPGGFPLAEKEQISVLQALSLAEGLDRAAGPKNARILREPTGSSERQEIKVNVNEILDGRAKDVTLQANDILFIPNNVAKSASMRALEAAVQAATGMAIYRR